MRTAQKLILCFMSALLFATPEFVLADGAGTSGALTEVATSDRQWTGVAVSKSGRVFVNYPRWSTEVPISVGELNDDGTVEPFPNRKLNLWDQSKNAATHFVCVQSVYVDAKDRLWILDPASPLFQGVVEGGAKLMQVDLTKNEIVRTYGFSAKVAPTQSYLNDVRVDTGSEIAFITDSGLGGIVVLDLASGEARRVLDDHASTKAESIEVVVQGRKFPNTVHSDGIALDATKGWLFYQALTGRTMYRVPTAKLKDASVSAEELAAAVAKFATSGVSDGLLYAHDHVWVSALEDDAIKKVSMDGRVSVATKDEKIAWPDSFALGPDGAIYFTTSQIHLGPNPETPYRIFKIKPDAD